MITRVSIKEVDVSSCPLLFQKVTHLQMEVVTILDVEVDPLYLLHLRISGQRFLMKASIPVLTITILDAEIDPLYLLHLRISGQRFLTKVIQFSPLRS